MAHDGPFDPKGHVRMTRFTKLTALALASALMAATVLAPASTTAAATPIDHLVDCSDSFWAIACFGEPAALPKHVQRTQIDDADPLPEQAPDGLIQIDSTPICVEIANDAMMCHT